MRQQSASDKSSSNASNTESTRTHRINRSARFMITLVLMLFALITFTQGASATPLTWNGNGPDASWSASASGGNKNNWTVKNAIPAENSTNDFIFAGTTRLNNINDINGLTATSITFTNAAGGFILNGNSITLAGGITNLSANLQTINL
ncbi:MAG: hypothetical protein WCO97_04875, partial [bacterium]